MSSSSSTERRAFWLLLAVTVPVVWVGMVRAHMLEPGRSNSVDALFHVRLADLTPPASYQRTFPWTTFSVWETHFHDKELLFHLGLAGLRRWNQLLGFTLEPPFHFSSIMLAGLVVLTFSLVCQRFNVPEYAWLSWLLVCAAPRFGYRLMMVRPHNLAIVLMLASTYAFARLDPKRHWWLAVALGMLFAYGYSQPHFVLLPAVAMAVTRAVQEQERNVRGERPWLWLMAMPLLALGGIVLGLLVHPQFPNGFVVWFIQAVQVVKQIVVADTPVHLGVEALGPDGAWLRQNAAVVFALPLANLLATLWLHRRHSLLRRPPEVTAVLAMQAVSVVGCFLSKRTIEYAAPFGFLALALLWREWHIERQLSTREMPLKSPLPAIVAGHVVAAACLIGVSSHLVPIHYPGAAQPLYAFADWAERTLPDGEVVFNLDWADFPSLFYSAPRLRFSHGLDPMFAYYRDPEKTATLESFRIGERILQPYETLELTHSRYIYLSTNLWQLARDLYQAGYQIDFQDPNDGWVFDVALSAVLRRQREELRRDLSQPPASPPETAPEASEP